MLQVERICDVRTGILEWRLLERGCDESRGRGLIRVMLKESFVKAREEYFISMGGCNSISIPRIKKFIFYSKVSFYILFQRLLQFVFCC